MWWHGWRRNVRRARRLLLQPRVTDSSFAPHDFFIRRTTVSEQDTSRRQFFVKLGVVLNGWPPSFWPRRWLAICWLRLCAAKADATASGSTWANWTNFPRARHGWQSTRTRSRIRWDGETDDIPCWVRRVQGETFQVFAINCAHLGCPVRWFPQSGLFMCPCHGGVYYQDGSRASGPPPRGLFEYAYKVENGHLMIEAGQLPTLSTSASLHKRSKGCQG